jgi:hypothetical protein
MAKLSRVSRSSYRVCIRVSRSGAGKFFASEAPILIARRSAFAIASDFIDVILASRDAVRVSRSKMQKVVSFAFSLCLCLVLTSFAYAETLVVLLEGLGGRVTSSGIVSLQEELSAIPNTIVALPFAQHNWRDAVKLIKQQKPETKIVVIGYSLGANNSTSRHFVV